MKLKGEKTRELRNFILDAKLLKKYMGDGLYYFHCQPLMSKQPAIFSECKPKFYKPRCLKCLLQAGKALYDYRFNKS